MIYLKANLPTGMLGYFEIGDAIELFHWEYSHITWMGRNRVYGAISSRTILNIRYSIRVMNFSVVFHLTNLRVSKTHCKIYESHWFRIIHDTESLWQRHPRTHPNAPLTEIGIMRFHSYTALIYITPVATQNLLQFILVQICNCNKKENAFVNDQFTPCVFSIWFDKW